MQKQKDPKSKEAEEKKTNTKRVENKEKVKRPKKKISQPKKKEQDKAQEEIGLLKDQLLRTAAELKNFKSRTEREVSDIIQNANKSIIFDLLTVVDDFERSLKSYEEKNSEHFSEGVTLIYTKMMGILKKYGLEPMESIGKPFSVEEHDALLQMEKEDVDPGVILDEHEKGYYLNGKILRHAKVIVSK